jgi:hypothetical protein
MSKKMTKEEKLELIVKALDLGAQFNIYFFNNTEEEAECIADQLGLGLEKHSKDDTYWLNHEDFNNRLELAVFYKPEEEEEELPFTDESIFLEDDVYLEDMRSEEYVSSFDLKVGEGL